jgi:EAL domain-containing protein (putative c-di-GMP-specific phosphodiesterase class I)
MIEMIINDGEFDSVYQPIVRTTDQGVIGHECLTRFRPEPYQSPDRWFAMADTVGLLKELELAAIHKALAALSEFDGYLSVNISPSTILKCDLEKELAPYPLKRLVLEITEHSAIDNYEEIDEALKDLRARGLHLAIDDAGAGYASMRHILMLSPDMVKIDRTITEGVDSHPGRQAMASAFRGFATRIGCALVAEGVETQAERQALEFIGVPHAQGFYFGEPHALSGHPNAKKHVGVCV